MGKYVGTLHKLIESACVSNSKKKWDQVIFYLQGHTVPNQRAVAPEFDSPLPPNVVPSPDLECELFDQQGPKKEDTPLRIAIKAAPANVVAALCHLGPEAVSLVDSRQRLPLHWACRRSSEDPETDKILLILIVCYQEALLQRDDGGRTPLHWLFWYHAKSRTPDIVKFMCQELPHDWFLDIQQPRSSATGIGTEQYPLPQIPRPCEREEIPQSAAIIPDSKHGALPLHYAVMQGATKEALKTLIQEYPKGIAIGDRRGRSALAWYLGAGSLIDDKKHVCGEVNDPNATPWWHTKLSLQCIQMLVSSKVARLEDDKGRVPLHWACHFFARNAAAGSMASAHKGGPSISNKIFQILLDHNIAAVTHQDIEGKTPLHVMFAVVASIQESEYQRLVANRSLRYEVDLTLGGPSAFQPPKQLLELLLKSPDIDGQDYFSEDGGHGVTAAYLEDENGLLPLHTALRAATSVECIQLLIQTNPTSLVHTSEEQMQTPLIHAYRSEYSAPLQPAKILEALMAAYVTSRHGTYMDGRLALKMEDAHGKFPIHYACQNQASFETIKTFVEKYNRCAIFQNAEGDLPIHCLLSQDHLFDSSESGVVNGASLAKPLGLLSEQELKRQQQMDESMKLKMRVLLEPLKLPEHLKIASSRHGMTPLHVAVAFNVLPYDRLYRMIDTYPESARMLTTQQGHQYSCLQLHDQLKEEVEDADQWYGIRELLYSFHPSLDTHRHDEELLDACVKLIRSEMLGHGSYHLKQQEDHELKAPLKIDLTETLSAINAPQIDTARRSTTRRANKLPVRPVKCQLRQEPVKTEDVELSASSSFTKMLTKKLERKESPKRKSKSIYDADLEDRYVVSPQNSAEDDYDVNEFEESSVEEEYYSDDGSSETDEGLRLERLESASWEEHLESASISESVSQTLSQTLSCVESVSFTSNKKSLLRKAISATVSGDTKPGNPDIFEEKKESMPNESLIVDEDVHLSEVAKRLWCFFVAHNNPKDPHDNYLQQVEAVLEDVDFDIAEQLIDLALSSYAKEYLQPGVSPIGLTMRDIASPKVKELFESYYYFVGRFEFPTDVDGVLIHRSSDNNTLWIRATEHIIQTVEYEPPRILDPGTAEEVIWKTGEVVQDEPGYIASRFKDNKRQVFFKLTRSSAVFENEVKCREEMGIKHGDEFTAHFLPLLSYFDRSGDRKVDRRFKMDSCDERFRTLQLYGGKQISLSDFPFAMVYPLGEEGDLFDYFYHQSSCDTSEVVDIALQVGKALQLMHDKGIIHGGLSMRSISMAPFDSDDPNPQRKWVISDLSRVRRNNKNSYMGGISPDGSALFETGLMPPEMFTKLSSTEEEICKQYWEKVEEIYGIQVDRQVVEPNIESHSGSSYTLRCFYEPHGRKKVSEGELPELPYMLVPARESTDLWSFGIMLYCMCSGGRPLFPTNVKSGHLLDHDQIVNWSKDIARAAVYEHVKDPVAQDILLLLLTSYESRNNLNIQTVLSHPFFSTENTTKSTDKLVEKRQNDCAAYMRNRTIVVNEKTEDDWLKSRTVKVHCWNFDLLKTFHFSSSEIVRRLTGKENTMPSSFLLLPYKLSAKNKKAKLAPTTKRDVERAERMGVLLLLLAKACHFGAVIDQMVKQSSPKSRWDAQTVLESVSFPTGDFDDLKEEFTKIAADRIEAFRSDPTTAVTKLIEKRYHEIKLFFKDAGKAFLYLVDEYMGVPLVGSDYEPYPLEISEAAMSKMLTKVLPFMHCCSMVVRGVSGGVSGIVRLIFEAAYPHVPPSWATAAFGLQHVLDEEIIQREVLLLHQALCNVNNSKSRRSLSDDLAFLRDSCSKADVKNDFGTMKRVQCGGSSIWTTPNGLETIQEACKTYDFKQALEIQSALETKLKSQESIIRQLQEKIEWLSFRKELNLKIPMESSISTHSASVTRKMDNTGHNSISVSTHSGVDRGDGPSPSASSAHSASRTTNTISVSKYTNAIDTPSPRKSIISPKSKVNKKTGSTSAQSQNSTDFFPDDEPEELSSDAHNIAGKDAEVGDESTVASEGTKETFRDLMSLD
ncbi:ankyrin repeat domain protein [Nitzschia inconspicua]|uniref:Ankyrin repeat domain protein n=1 Tax=Nitzschia inconspicua TaxID=303405 RepID=A0A9K3PEF7_9STRA|nr:ankyrin repeat domain protein [Nitzschia inconspicua]